MVVGGGEEAEGSGSGDGDLVVASGGEAEGGREEVDTCDDGCSEDEWLLVWGDC